MLFDFLHSSLTKDNFTPGTKISSFKQKNSFTKQLDGRIEVKIMHREFFKDELLGVATIHLKDFNDGNAHVIWIPLTQEPAKKGLPLRRNNKIPSPTTLFQNIESKDKAELQISGQFVTESQINKRQNKNSKEFYNIGKILGR